MILPSAVTYARQWKRTELIWEPVMNPDGDPIWARYQHSPWIGLVERGRMPKALESTIRIVSFEQSLTWCEDHAQRIDGQKVWLPFNRFGVNGNE